MNTISLDSNAKSLITRRINIVINDIYSQIIVYFGCIQEFVFRYSTTDTAIWKTITGQFIKKCKTIISSLDVPASDVKHLLERCLKLYDDLESIDTDIKQLMVILENKTYDDLMKTQTSQNTILEMLSTKNNIYNKLSSYKNVILITETKQTHDILYDMIKPLENLDVLHDIVYNASYNDFLVYVLARIIKTAPASKTIKLMDRVEQLKNNALKSVTVTKIHGQVTADTFNLINRGFDTVQLMTQRHGLYPTSVYFNVKDLFTELKYLYVCDDTIDVNFRNLAKFLTHGIVIVCKRTSKLIEYNLHNLINANSALISDSAMGINEQMLKRFNTVKAVESKPNNGYMATTTATATDNIANTMVSPFIIYDNNGDMIDVHNNGHHRGIDDIDNVATWIIIERVDVDTTTQWYKLLGHASAVKKSAMIHNGKFVRELISGASTRDHNYNVIHENLIMQVAVNDDHRALMSAFESAAENSVLSESVKTAIADNAEKQFVVLLEKNPDAKLDQPRFIEFIQNACKKMLKSVILEQMYELLYVEKPKKSLELRTTFVIQMDLMLSKFFREYDTVVSNQRDKITRSKFTELRDKMLIDYLVGWFHQILHLTLYILDAEPASLNTIQLSLKEFAIKFGYVRI